MGGLGGLFGGLSALAKVGKVAQFIGGAAADLAIGVAWDMAVHKQTPSEALFGNLISFGIGFGIGRGISGAGRLAGRNADNANVRGGNNRIENTNQNIGAGSRNWKLDDAQPTDRIPNQAQPFSCTAACSVVLLRDQGINVSETDVMRYLGTDGSELITMRRVERALNQIVSDLSPNSNIRFESFSNDDLGAINYLTTGDKHIMAFLGTHAVIVESVDFDRQVMRLLDPEGKGVGTGVAEEGTLSFESFNYTQYAAHCELLRCVIEK